MKPAEAPYSIHSIADLHRLLGLPSPDHPLVSMIRLADLRDSCVDMPGRFVYQFYSVCIKKDFNGKLKYGQQYYDFDNGTMTFFAPGQVISVESSEDPCFNGWWLAFHRDFFSGHPLAAKMLHYGFFSYAANEALHVSAQERATMMTVFNIIDEELNSRIDEFSQDVIISQIELLLTYSDRYYKRQFITRKAVNHELLQKLDDLLEGYFSGEVALKSGIPTVQYLSDQLHLSPSYLSDMLRSLTGQNAQHLIHHKLVEKAKELLSTSDLSVAEIAYQLGFEHPQSLSRLFKLKTSHSPLEFKQSFN